MAIRIGQNCIPVISMYCTVFIKASPHMVLFNYIFHALEKHFSGTGNIAKIQVALLVLLTYDLAPKLQLRYPETVCFPGH